MPLGGRKPALRAGPPCALFSIYDPQRAGARSELAPGSGSHRLSPPFFPLKSGLPISCRPSQRMAELVAQVRAMVISPVSKPLMISAVLLLLSTPLLSCLDGISAGPDDDEIVGVVVQPPRATIDVDGSVQLTATVYDRAGRVVQAEVSWTSSSPSVANVDEEGLVRGVSLGVAIVRASTAGKTGISEITVRLIGPH